MKLLSDQDPQMQGAIEYKKKRKNLIFLFDLN